MLEEEKGTETAGKGPAKNGKADEKDHAYEDSWYRSLKASAKNRHDVATEGDDEEEGQA